MKAIKISLVLIVVVAIAVGILVWNKIINPPPLTPPVENSFTRIIEQEIEQLKDKPESKFCKEFYMEIAYHIKEFYKPLPPTYPYGRFGKTQSQNDQWKEILEKNLYAAYAEKFIKQAKFVFRGSEWKAEDLKIIQAEKNELKNSKLLVAGSPVDKDFTTIQTALNKYNEIVSFISSCKGFSYSSTVLRESFPITDVQSKTSHAASLLQNRLGNVYVNNCSRLHDGLKEIPKVLFEKHVWYLDNKINFWSGMYSNYPSHRSYSENLYQPIEAEILALKDNQDDPLYNVSHFYVEYNRLLQKWSADNTKAYNYNY